MNLFRAIHLSKDEFYLKDKPLYDHKFAFTSVMEKINKMKVFFVRDLSQEARCNARQTPEHTGDIKDHNFEAYDFNQLRFEDLINVASGRCTPEVVFNQFNHDKHDDKSDVLSEVEDETEIIYKKHSFSKGATINKDY